MIIHAQRENGLAHRTMTLRPWQVQALRLFSSRWVVVALSAGLFSWGYFALQAARVPFLLTRLERMERDSRRLDSLQRTVTLLQGRYEQVQRMLVASTIKRKEAKRTPQFESQPPVITGLKTGSTEEAKKQPN